MKPTPIAGTTYERLRQICNPSCKPESFKFLLLWPSCFDTDPPKIYSVQVGVMNVNTPPDACNEQVGQSKTLF